MAGSKSSQHKGVQQTAISVHEVERGEVPLLCHFIQGHPCIVHDIGLKRMLLRKSH